MGFQSNVPGDYYGYQEIYNSISNGLSNFSNYREDVGWLYLNYVIGQIANFKVFILLLSAIETLILAKFIDKYTLEKYRYIAGVLFFFSMNMMLFQMKGLRQGFAIELLLASIFFINDRKYIKSLCVTILAVLMHKSSILAIPYLLLFPFAKKITHSESNRKSGHLVPSILAALYFLLLQFKPLYIDYFQPIFMALDLSGYEGYFGEMSVVTYHILISIYGAIAVYAIAYSLPYLNFTGRYFGFISLIGLFVENFFFGQGDLFRLALYYTIFTIISLPNAATVIYKKNKLLSLCFIVLCIAYAYRTFITMTIRHSTDGFDNYKFIFEIL